MPIKLVDPRPGKSPNFTLRGTVTAGPGKSRPVNETTGTPDRRRAEEIRARREAEILGELIHGIKPRHSFEDAAIGYAATLAPCATQRVAVIGRQRRDGSTCPCLVSDFAGWFVDQIDQEAVDDVTKKRFAGKKPGTVVRELIQPLTAVLNWASRRDWCKPPRFERPKYKDQRKRWADYAEAARLLNAAPVWLRPILLFLILTGCRIGEAAALDWDDVNLTDRWLVFRNTKRNKRGADLPGEDRGVPLHPQLVTVLANLPHRVGRVFRTAPGSRGRGQPYKTRPYPGGNPIDKPFHRACRLAGIIGLRVHDLRHTCSTWLTLAGTHEQWRDEIIGHSSTSMGRRYAHIPRPPLIEAIDRLPWVGVEVGGKSVEGRLAGK